MNDFPTLSNFDPKDYVFEDRYPKRNRKNKIPVENLSSLEEPDYINKAEKLTCLPYKIETILASQDFEHDEFITKIPIEEFSLEYIRRTGLSTPLFFNVPPDDLGMKMPDPEKFTVDDVLECVGGERKIEVVEVYTQNGRLMKLREFIDYYKGPPECRPDLLNVLSLEFSSTKLAELVSAPAFVSQIDWIDNVWPKELYARQADLLRKSTWAEENDFSTYPKVQRYCLMSVANCFTDFHIDFGGTSVWYHILKGEKVFWLIEPTEENLKLYEEWILGGSNNSSFFGNVVNKCARIHLVAGNTLVIPSGWIHCVYTPCDSLVFGGNFLHNYAVPMQIRISKSEDRIRIGNKYRFPHFKQIFWCYIAKVLREATGRVYQRKPPTIAHVKNSAYARKTKKSSLSSTPEGGEPSASEQPEKEELPHSQPADVQMMASDGANVVPESDGEDVGIGLKFFDDFGNAEDGSFTFNPIQLKFGDVDEANFVAATDYNEEYIRSLSSFEINGFHSLLSFANRLIKKQPEVVEGITRPSNLITELEAFLKHLAEAGLLNLQMDLDLSPKMPLVQGFVEWNIDTLPKETTEVFVKLPPKRKQNKRRSAESASFSSTKKPTKQEPILVDGLPLATHGFDHNNGHNNGFDPIAQVVKLGHNPIASAWRRFGTTSDVLQPPSMDFPSVEKKPDTSSNLAEEFSIAESAKPPSPDLNSNESPTLDETVEEKKPIAKKKFRIPRGPPKIVEKHDDSPEFTHRSPLQRFFTQKPAANVSNPASRTFAEPSVSKPYNHNQQQTGYHRDRDSRDRNGEGGWRSEYGNRRDSYQRSQDPVENRPRSFSSNSNNNHYDGNRSNQYNNNNSNNGFSNNGFDNSGFDRWRGGNNNGNGDGQFDSFSGGGFSADRPSKSMDDSSQYDYENSTSTVNRNISTAEAEQRRSPAEVAYGYGNPQQQQDRAVRPQSQSKHSDSVKREMEEMPAQPMSTTVNELHHLSQIMDCPNYVDIDQIPLPPSPAKPAQNAAEGREFEEEQHRRPADPFNEVDELASLGQLMC